MHLARTIGSKSHGSQQEFCCFGVARMHILLVRDDACDSSALAGHVYSVTQGRVVECRVHRRCKGSI